MPRSSRFAHRPRRSIHLVWALLTCMLAVPLLGQRPEAMVESKWWPEVRALDERLRDGDWKKVRREAHRLAKEVTAKSWHHPDLKAIFAELAFFEAVAVANLGGDDPWAVWLWHIAQNADPRIRSRDLEPYGRAAKLLVEHYLREHREIPYRWSKEISTGVLQGRRLERPKDLDRGDKPVTLRSDAVATERLSKMMLIEVILDREGRPHQPVVYSPQLPHPAVVYSTLRAVYDGKYAPLKVDGEPRTSLLEIHMSFEVLRGAS